MMLQSRKRHHHCSCIHDCNWGYENNEDIVSPMFTNFDDLIDFIKEQRGSSCSWGFIYVYYIALSGRTVGDITYFFEDGHHHIVTSTSVRSGSGSHFSIYLIPSRDGSAMTYFSNPFVGKTTLYNEDNSKIAGDVNGSSVNSVYGILENLASEDNSGRRYEILGYRWQNCAASLRQAHANQTFILPPFNAICQKTHCVIYSRENLAPTNIRQYITNVDNGTVYTSYDSSTSSTIWRVSFNYGYVVEISYEDDLSEMTLDDASNYSIDDVPGVKLGEVWTLHTLGGALWTNSTGASPTISLNRGGTYTNSGSVPGRKTRAEIVEMINNGEIQVQRPTDADIPSFEGNTLANRYCEMLFYEE